MVSALTFKIWNKLDELWDLQVKSYFFASVTWVLDVPDTGLLCDLLWADPEKEVAGWAENDRGVSFTFGQDIVNKFLNKHDLGKHFISTSTQ